jgi:hypothetical protein
MQNRFKLDIIALVIAGLAMVGTISNTCFTWWSYLQQERVLLDITCEPVLNEPVNFGKFLDAEMITFFAKCTATNISSKKVYITNVFAKAGLRYGEVEEDPVSPGESSSRYYGQTPSYKFTPDDTGMVYQYDESKENLKPFALPMAVDGREQVTFFVKMELLTTQEMIKKFNTTCPDRLKRKITLTEIFGGCMNGRVEYYYSDFHITPDIAPKNILYEITPDVRVCAAGRFYFDAKSPTIYIVKKN